MKNKDYPDFVLVNLNYTELFHNLTVLEAGKMFFAVIDKYRYKKEIDIENGYTKAIADTWCNDIEKTLARRDERRQRLSERGKRNIAKRWTKNNQQPNIPFIEVEEAERYPFEAFWNLYDRKLDTSKCKRLWRRISDEDKAQIMAHVAEYVAATEKQYRRNPYNYLCNRGWEDEIIQQNYGNNHIQQDRRSEQQVNEAKCAQTMARMFADLERGGGGKRHSEATEDAPI